MCVARVALPGPDASSSTALQASGAQTSPHCGIVLEVVSELYVLYEQNHFLTDLGLLYLFLALVKFLYTIPEMVIKQVLRGAFFVTALR
jgi:hypothetical protein